MLATVTTIIAGWWKGRLVVRSDRRRDRGEQTDAETREDIIESLRDEVRRLTETVTDLSLRLDAERKLRFGAEDRIAVLEHDLKLLRSEARG